MADKKISQLTAATTPLSGTEVLPLVQGSTTVKVANNDLRPKQIQSNATSGVLQVVGPADATTRVMTTPNANFTAARTDAAQTFTGTQTFSDTATFSTVSGNVNVGTSGDTGGAKLVAVDNAKNQLICYGYSETGGSNGPSGQLQLGNQTYNGKIQYSGTAGQLFIDNTYDQNSGNIIFRTKTSGTALRCLTIFGTSGVSVGDTTDPGAGNLRVGTGNLVIGTDGKGIDFTATPGTGTSELLDDYEEGTWTPDTSFLTIVGTASSEGTYTKIGRTVVVRGSVAGSTSVTVGASGILVGGLPFTTATDSIGTMAASTNLESGNIRATGPFLVATNAITPVASITFTAIYFV